MKRIFLVGALVVLCVTGVFADRQAAGEGKNLIGNPGFEEVNEMIISTTWMQSIKEQGCDVADGPIAVFPNGWNFQFWGTKGKMRVVERAKEGEQRKEVYSGKRALFMGGSDKEMAVFYNGRDGGRPSYLPSPNYVISIYARGKGTIYLRTYEYNLKWGIVGAPLKYFPVSDDWTKYEWIYESGKNTNPDFKRFCVVVGVTPGAEVYLDEVELAEKAK